MRSDDLQMRGPESQLSPTQHSAPGAGPSGLVFKTRHPSACKECRRRKQKCSLTQPCTNCARRFPQPVCEYGAEKPKRSSYAPTSDSRGTVARAGNGLYSHLDMEAVHDALLQVEGQVDWETRGSGGGGYGFSPYNQPIGGPSGRLVLVNGGGQGDADPLIQLRFRDKTGTLNGQDLVELMQFILKTRLKVTNSIIQDEWQIDGAHLIRAVQGASQPSNALARFEDEVRYLPMAPTKMNKELIRTHLQLMSRFKASLDGSPRPNNRFMKHWIPYSIQDPLVLHVILCSTASFLNETGRVPKVMLLIHRTNAMRMINEHISDPRRCTDDSAMLAVAQSILTSWYWGSTAELRTHMVGFKRMIEMRGGMQSLGMEGYTSKISLIDDFVIALVHETRPMLFGQPGFDFEDPVRVPLQVNFNSPLLFDCPPFLSPASPLRLHPHTAQILDEMRTVHRVVADLSDDATDEEEAAVYLAADAALTAILYVPEDVALVEGDSETSTGPSNLSGGLKRKRQGDDTAEPRKAATTALEVRAATAEEMPDLVHRCVRKAALIYCQAVRDRVSTSRACSEDDFNQVWHWAWGAGLDRWAALSGIFVWVMIAVVPSSLSLVHSRMVKSLLVTGFMYLGTENWHVAADIAAAGLKMQRWLRGRRNGSDGGVVSEAWGGEKVVEKHGFAFKDEMPDVVPATMEEEHESDA